MKIEIDGVNAQRRGARPLKEARVMRGLKQEDVAAALGAEQSRVMFLEMQDIGILRLHVLKGYIEAIGGRLSISVEFDGKSGERT